MGTTLQDGRSSNTALIDSNFNLHAQTNSVEEKDHACESGDKYNINTGDITLTDANATDLIYIKNNEDSDLIVTALIYNLGASASGTGDVTIDIIRNPTAGDIVTNANNVAVGTGVSANQNFGANKSLSIDAYKGATSEGVFSDGAVTVSTRSAANTGRIVISLGNVTIPKGSSIGVQYTPPSGNTSQIVQVAAACYLRTTAVYSAN